MCADLWFYSVVKAAVFAEQIAVNCTYSYCTNITDSSCFSSCFLAIAVCLGVPGLGEAKLKWDFWDAPKGWGRWLLFLVFVSQQRDSFPVGELPLAL